MVKMVDVDKIPEKQPSLSLVVDEFIRSGKHLVKLDLESDERPKQVIYVGLYNALKNKTLNAKVQMVNGEIYLMRTDSEVVEGETEAAADNTNINDHHQDVKDE